MSTGEALRLMAERLDGPAQFYQVPGIRPTDDDADTFRVTVERGDREREAYVLARSREQARELVLADVERDLLDEFVA